MTLEEYYQKSEICGKHYPKCENCPYCEECRQEVEAMESLHLVSNSTMAR